MNFRAGAYRPGRCLRHVTDLRSDDSTAFGSEAQARRDDTDKTGLSCNGRWRTVRANKIKRIVLNDLSRLIRGISEIRGE